ncbi:autotransporter outer membrane beta-barrel domain-containing protein [Chachezhania sediminis]|uniref:autotransporter outer membrane beta-barrel domain-containing protein n=1 Tax=Chachezhania sediminis TaxID=2599291 RepID=UPI00131E8567|nr:autotransporter outer membrane beta-barrel domain-containing protein [Chachezhania sediminis]
MTCRRTLALLAGSTTLAILPQLTMAATCSQDGDDRTCTGEYDGFLSYSVGNVTGTPTYSFTVEQLTNTSPYRPPTPDSPPGIASFVTAGPGTPTMNFSFNADRAIDFEAASFGYAIVVTGTGDAGKAGDPDKKGSGSAKGGAGDNGADGATVNATVASTAIDTNTGWIVASTGGKGGDGGKGDSVTLGDGTGGKGGDGGKGGAVTQVLSDVTLSGQSGRLQILSAGGDGGHGGKSYSADYKSRAGAGGAGGDGGNVALELEGTNLFNAETASIFVASTAGNGADGGKAKNGLTTHATGGHGGQGGDGGTASVRSTAAGTTTVASDVNGLGILVQSIAGDGGQGGDGNSGGGATGGDGGVGGSGGLAEVVTTTDHRLVVSTRDGNMPAIAVRSYGGAGGDGGKANGVFGKATGGAGSGAGPGGEAHASVSGQLATSGADATGLLIQSVGGFAGNGGQSSAIVAYGSSSESAGNGGQAVAAFTAAGAADGISTTGEAADAIFVQSIGGGGGKGSSSSGIVSLSGSGSAGGNGGPVAVTTTGGAFSATGDLSRGIVAQSIGGGGGDGGSASAVVSIGGAGSHGGAGGQVQVSVGTDITTGGGDGVGILAQSVGGGGGSASSTSGLVSIGGSGGSGATAGAVEVNLTSQIETAGTGADGLFAQSVGGGGGHGSNTLAVGAGFSLAMGGNGGKGNDGGSVTARTEATAVIAVGGDNSSGIVATSTGGGGGTAGNAISVSAGGTASIALAFGGKGGAAGDGGTVTVDNLAQIKTLGANGIGIAAMSIGGGGGNAGTTVAATAGETGISAAVGGNGSGSGRGGAVTVCNGTATGAQACNTADATAGDIATSGDNGHGIYATSTGGSGGHSGNVITGGLSDVGVDLSVGGNGGKGGAGGAVAVYSNGNIQTAGAAAQGVLATSIGGSGGASYATGAITPGGTADINASIGGTGGDAGDSGDVTVIATGPVTTARGMAGGVTALSVAGSGGTGGVAFTGNGISMGDVGVNVGGKGGGGGTAGAVSVSVGGIATTGDHATGLAAMSLGGSGGIGGYAVSGAAASAASVGVSLGGAGGKGGTAGTVDVGVAGDVATAGDLSHGIVAMSLGGNGGLGGAAISATAVSQGNVGVALGGTGGTGGTASTVDVTLDAGAAVRTGGVNAIGLQAISQGGNGGNGGFAMTGGISVGGEDDIPATSVTVAVGGGGGKGGAGKTVTVESEADFATADFGSIAILAQSVGGDGGSGGAVYSGTINAGSTSSVDVAVDVGGKGGDGGASDNVTVSSEGTVATRGDNADAILAQSIGGNGGAGGNSYNVLLNAGSNTKNQIKANVVIGGSGGDGAKTGNATITNSGAITTAGTSSDGLNAQSVGGNGGQGGSGGNAIVTLGSLSSGGSGNSVAASLNVEVGGSGGSGAPGGAAIVTNSGTINTAGTAARGIFAQSVGGSGGDGGAVSTYSFSFTAACNLVYVNKTKVCKDAARNTGSSVSGALQVAVGGNGGKGNNGGSAIVTNKAAVTTTGDSAHAIMAQSVGGGGGTGGAASKGLSSFTSSKTASEITNYLNKVVPQSNPNQNAWTTASAWTSLNVFIGGQGKAGGDGGTAMVTNSANVATAGSNAYAIFAQSVGAGGGSGGEAAGKGSSHTITVGGSGGGAGDGGTVAVTNRNATIATAGDASTAIFAQSIGGGGGNAGNQSSVDIKDVSIVVGGEHGQSGNGGTITITDIGTDVATAGLYSVGILAQSIGGGGGTSFGAAGENATGSVDVTGHTSVTGDGGAITINHRGSITTTGAAEGQVSNAHGIVAQSVGGGGGLGGALVFGSSATFGSKLGDRGGKGDGGTIIVMQTGDITTTGDHSVGILAQSLGGGGGLQGNVTPSSTGAAARIGAQSGKGSGGNVNVSLARGSTIRTSGVASHGIFAQSAGGSGSNKTTGTTVKVVVDGAIDVTGAGAHGVVVTSTGDGSGMMEIDVAGSVTGGTEAVVAGAEDGAGLMFRGPGSSVLNNSGSVSSQAGIDGIAIYALDTDLTINNTGTITGDINKASGVVLNNRQGGTIHAGRRLDVDRVVNNGTLTVHGDGTIGRTRVTGDFVNGDNGIIQIDVDPTNPAAMTDTLQVDGATQLRGRVAANFINSTPGPEGAQMDVILNGPASNDLSQLTIVPSAVGQYGLVQLEAGKLHLSYDINFVKDSVTNLARDNQDRLARYFHQLYRRGELDPELFSELMTRESDRGYVGSLNSLGMEIVVDTQMAAYLSSLRFAERLINCERQSPQAGGADDGSGCSWIRVGGRHFIQDAKGDNLGFSQDSYEIAGGSSMPFADMWKLDGALAYERHNITGNDNKGSADGYQFLIGGALSRQAGTMEYGVYAAFSTGNFDTSRQAPGGIGVDGSYRPTTAGGGARLAWTLQSGRMTWRPQVELGATYLNGSSFQETPSSAYALDIDPASETIYHLRPSLAFWGDYKSRGGTQTRLSGHVGLTQFLGDATPRATGHFVSMGASGLDFSAQTKMDSTRLDLGLGLDILTKKGSTISLNANAGLSETTRDIGAGVQVRFVF